ncbi:hypothetical protein MMC08_007634 [Hypocenomyce scalaris]|nr:hypothetical protein [Hypocenomyce scalaris]
MSATNGTATVNLPRVPPRLYLANNPPSLPAFKSLCSQTASSKDYPLCSGIQSNVPIYDTSRFQLADPSIFSSLQDEWHHILLSGPGVLVLMHMYQDTSLLEKVNGVFQTIVASESASTKGDHFASGGKNDRVWNSFHKHGITEPASFIQYYSNPWLALICDAWLGPAYRITAQVNIVKPGMAAQVSHRDYHLGFQTAETCAKYPIPMHIASQHLTLQGAVAHSNMPVESGPTRLLPFSQMFKEGFMAYRLPEFNEYFLEKHVSLPLQMGDGIFFNPALFHAAGANRTETFERSANLLQVSSAFGKTMETIESISLVEQCWDGLREKYEREGMSGEVQAFVAAVAEGYPFPTNLDRRAPAPGRMAPDSEQDIVTRGLWERWDLQQVMGALKQMRQDSRA